MALWLFALFFLLKDGRHMGAWVLRPCWLYTSGLVGAFVAVPVVATVTRAAGHYRAQPPTVR